MQGLPANTVTRTGRGLLPHVFNLTPPFPKERGGSYFLWHYLFPDLHQEAGSSPVHCSVLSGLSSPAL